MKNNITFVIFTYNEEKRIEKVIQNFKDFGQILLADNKSTDRTLEIAKSYGCSVFTRQKDYIFVEEQELVEQLKAVITTDWIYWGFADEMLEKDALLEIQSAIAADKCDIINIDRKNYFHGKFCYDLFHARTNKIFKKQAIDFRDNPIHGMGKPLVPENRILKLPSRYFVHHFISNSALSYLNTINRYTESELMFPYKANKSVFQLLFQVLTKVGKQYFLNKGYKAGFSGLALTELMLVYAFAKNMKHYEKDNQLEPVAIEHKNDQYRDKILAGL